MILSTEDHLELMKAVAAKTSSQLSILPPVSSTGDDHNNAQETEVSQPQAISGVFAFMFICIYSACFWVSPAIYSMLYFRR